MKEKNIYNNLEYKSKNPTWHSEHSFWKANNIKKLLKKNNIEISKVCEVGCGAGEILVSLSKYFKKTYFFGYEISKDIFKTAKKKENSRLKFKLGNIPKAKKYDLLLCIDVFEHVEDYMGFLREIKNRGKYHIFHIPLDINAFGLFRNRLIKERKAVGHLHYFTKETALSTLEDLGYQIIDWNYTDSFHKGGIVVNENLKSKLFYSAQFIINLISPRLLSRTLGGLSLLVLTK